jgi:hypothetical protein
MQLGTRWNVGDEAPARLPETVVAAVRAVEAELGERPGWRWTLTWLEGRPVVELDDGTIIRLEHDGGVSVSEPGN